MENDIRQTLKAPAVALIVTGTINGAVAFLTLVSGLFRLVAGVENLPDNEAERLGFFVGTAITYIIAFVALVAAPVIVYGGTKMLNGKSYGLVKAAAVLSILPFTSCCFLISIPIGIWVFVV
ncbi:MAG: hypothetical protein OEQ28_16450, partial [Acidobacteriota bacterium]|nr:hypothetical protein [Acidobacteriota bacterium]